MKFLSQINVNTEYTLPIVDGALGQVLTTDGNGAVYWGSVSAGSTNLDALTDVILTSPSSGQLLRYGIPPGSGETQPVWYNFTPTYLTPSSSIDALSDVTITTATTGQILQWSGSQWVNATLSTVEYVSKVQHLVKCGVAVTKGQAVYVTTSDGTNMIVGLASNASEPTSSKVIGLAASTGAINDQIFVVTEGLIAGLNTSTATAGDPVWLGTGGNLIFGLANKPVAPAHLVYLGVVTRVQSNNGEIFVNVQNGFELNELHDVLISSPSTGQLVRRDSDGLWKNWSPNFLTAEADTLATVTGRGATTSLAISANGVTSPNFTSTALMIVNADTSGSLQPDQGSPANKIVSFRWQGSEGGYIDTNNVITFSGFKTPAGTASQFLKANGTVDSNTYLTTTLAAATYATFGYVDDEIAAVNTYVQDYFVPKTRTLTINGTAYDLSANRSWTISTADSTKVSKAGESHDTVQPNNLGAGDGGFYTVASNYGPSGGNDALIHIPYSNSLWAHQMAFDWSTGDNQDMWFRTKNNGTWQAWKKVWHDGNFTDNSSYWNAAYNDKINSAAVTGTTTKTLTLTQQDGGTITASWTDYDSDNDAQTLSWTAPSKELAISNGNSITLDGLATEDYVLSQGFTTFQPWNSGTGGINYPSGNIGIGVPAPEYLLDFGTLNEEFSTDKLRFNAYNGPASGGSGVGAATGGGTSQGAGIIWKPNYSGYSKRSAGILQIAEGNYFRSGLAFYVNNFQDSSTDFSEAMRIASNSNVGINTTNPVYRLDVNGNSRTTGIHYVDTYLVTPIIYGGGPITMGNDVIIDSNSAWNASAAMLNVGGSGDGRIQVRHIYGKAADSANADHLWLNYQNTGKHVQVGDSGGGNNLYVSGDIYANGYFAGNVVATRSWVQSQGYITGYTETDTFASVVSRGNSTSGSIVVGGNITVSSNNSTGGGIILADDGDIVDLNDSYCSMRFSSGVRIFSANRGGSPVITLGSNGVVSASGGNSSQWNTAYGWGNHADAPYWNVSLNNDIQVESNQVTFAGDVIIQGTLTESSSIRYKENIQPLEPALAKVEQLNPVTYTKIATQEEEIGLIAEEVAELFPEVVKYNEEGQPDGISYSRLSVILLKAVQELTNEVKELKEKLK